jgi:multidomain signaling protein FimX
LNTLTPRSRGPSPAVRILVAARSSETAERINALLRQAGIAVQCQRVGTLAEVENALDHDHPELVVIAADDRVVSLEAIASLRARTRPSVPVLLLLDTVNESSMTTALEAGAQDVVSTAHERRLALVATRELRAFRAERALESSVAASREFQRALATLRDGSTDAIAEVVEGIIVAANPAWLELFGYTELGSLAGLPLLDVIATRSHGALKGALAAATEGHWPDEAVHLLALKADGSTTPVEVFLSAGAHEDGEPDITLRIAIAPRQDRALEERLGEAIRTDPTTGLLHRPHLVAALKERIAAPPAGGVRAILVVQLDHPEAIASRTGPLAAETFIGEFARIVRAELLPGDIGGRLTASSLLLLTDRGNRADVEAFAAHLVAHLAEHPFRIEETPLSITATVGIGLVPSHATGPEQAVRDAVEAVRIGRLAGGNRLELVSSDPIASADEAEDTAARTLKSALMHNRLRLLRQPVASLIGKDPGLYDVLVRIDDEAGREILPAEFLVTAARHDLVRTIDRWVVGAALSVASVEEMGGLFVRLSADSLRDRSLETWLSQQITQIGVDPSRLCIEITQSMATELPQDTAELREGLRRIGARFAIEHVSIATDARAQIANLKPDFVKIDGSLMQGLSTRPDRQNEIRMIADAARVVSAQTIAERVEDASTMAALWQLGVQFIQGYYVQKPESLVLG